MQPAASRSAVRSSRRTAFMGIGIFGLAGIGVMWLWWTTAMRTPVVTIPSPVMPRPNAFDFYVKAGNTVVGYKQIGNAFGTKQKVVYSLAQKEALIRPNIGVIDTVHQGFAYRYCNPPSRSFNTPFPYYARFRGLSRLLALQAQARAERENWSGAADSCLDAVRLGADIPYGSPLIGDLVGIACQAIGRRQMWSVVEHLNAAQSRSAISRLMSIMDRRLPYTDTLQEEKWAMQANLLEVFNDPKKAATLADGKTDDPNVSQKQSVLFYLFCSKTRIMENYTTYMDRSVQVAQQPYGLHLPSPPLPKDPINRELLPVYEAARLKNVENETQNGLLLVVLALHAFRMEHGQYPVSLNELAPVCLKKLPNDPFAVQGTFKYRVTGRSYVLYSVGPDGKDDGGMPIDNPKHPESSNPNARYFVEQNSVGDVVAGKNTW